MQRKKILTGTRKTKQTVREQRLTAAKRRVTMRFQDFFRFGVINLSRRKARTVLTALSMAIGVMCIIVLISVGIGYEKSYEETIQSMGSLTKIDVTPSTDERGAQALLNDKAVDAMKKLDGVDAVTPVVQATAYLKSGKYISMVKLYVWILPRADHVPSHS